MLRWLRYGTPNEPIYSQFFRLIIALALVGVGAAVIGLILKFLSVILY